MLAHIVRELRLAGISEALFIVSDRKPQIASYFGNLCDERLLERHNLPPLRCSYVTQTTQRGLGDAILISEDWVGKESFVVAFGDCIIDSPTDSSHPLRRMISTHLEKAALATVLVEKVALEKVSRYGILTPLNDQADKLAICFPAKDIVEKPTPETAPSRLAVAARWILNPDIFDALRHGSLDSKGELNLTDVIKPLLTAGGILWGVPLLPGEARRDIGNFETFFAAFIRHAFEDSEYGETTRKLAAELLELYQK